MTSQRPERDSVLKFSLSKRMATPPLVSRDVRHPLELEPSLLEPHLISIECADDVGFQLVPLLGQNGDGPLTQPL
jgi:hypothetical protein